MALLQMTPLSLVLKEKLLKIMLLLSVKVLWQGIKVVLP